MNQQEQNNQLLESFLKRTFYSGWRDSESEEYGNFRQIEIFLNAQCNLACKYCYLNRYGKKLYPTETQKKSLLLKNLGLLIDWIIENDYKIEQLEYFSGDPLTQEVGLEGLEMILERFKDKKNKPGFISVPTNFTFLLSEENTKRVEKIIDQSRKTGSPVCLSASFDGKYCEANRPFKTGKEVRDDKYYNKAFAFAKKWQCGFHPMVYSENIEKWKDNWLWFQENFDKHEIPWANIYLLEVRNFEWTDRQLLEFGKFIEFLIEWIFVEKCKKDLGSYLGFLTEMSGCNILGSPLSTCGRGLGCSIQSAVIVRVGDLTWVPCHRTSYSPLILGSFEVKNGKIAGIKAHNPEFAISMYSHDFKNQPMCEACLLKSLCSGGCLGSQTEVTGDPYTPIPTVCQLQHIKVASMIRAYKRLGIFEAVLTLPSPEKQNALRIMAEDILNFKN